MSFFLKYRKAIVAFLTPLFGLPLLGWLSGEVDFDSAALGGAIVAGISGILTWWFSNREPAAPTA